MTVAEFKSDPQLPGQWAKELAQNPILRLVLFDVMEENHPDNFPAPTNMNDDLSRETVAVLYGEAKGYSKYRNTLKFLAKSSRRAIDIGEPTYSKEEIPKNG